MVHPAARLTVPGLTLLLLLGGCARQSVILVPDPQGHVGMVDVITAKGRQVLAQAGDMTRTQGASSVPTAVTQADPAFIQSTFGEALAIEPLPPQAYTLMFESGSTTLTADSLKDIAAIAAECKQRSAQRVRISGHTDATGSDQLNDALALERAEAVKALLVQQGLDPEMMTVTSHGKGNPAIPTPDGVAEPRNRRVVVIVR